MAQITREDHKGKNGGCPAFPSLERWVATLNACDRRVSLILLTDLVIIRAQTSHGLAPSSRQKRKGREVRSMRWWPL